MAQLLQLAVGGLSMGAIYGLVALGFTLIWNAVSIVNFAQGDFVMIAAFVSVGWLVLGFHVSWWASFAVALAFMIVFGVAFSIVVYHPVRNAPQLAAIIATLGLSTFLENVAVLIWGPVPLAVPGPFRNATVALGGVKLYEQYMLILAALVVLVIVQQLMFHRTVIGKAMRATAQDAEMARLMGINTDVVVALVFAYASVLAGVAGVLLAPVFYVATTMGVTIALKAFAASIMGGFGNPTGAVIGGLLLGLLEAFGGYFISSAYIDVIAFGVLIVFLVVRPQGIFGEPALERP